MALQEPAIFIKIFNLITRKIALLEAPLALSLTMVPCNASRQSAGVTINSLKQGEAIYSQGLSRHSVFSLTRRPCLQLKRNRGAFGHNPLCSERCNESKKCSLNWEGAMKLLERMERKTSAYLLLETSGFADHTSSTAYALYSSTSVQ